LRAPAARVSIGQALLFAPIAAASAYAGYFAVALLLAGLAAGTEDVAFGLDSGAPGWLFAVVGVLLLAGVAALLWLGWLVAAARASTRTLIVVALLCAPPLLLLLTGVVAGGLQAFASPLSVAPYLLLLALWRLAERQRRGLTDAAAPEGRVPCQR